MIVLVSNFLNHHQLPFCHAMCRLTDHAFAFVATESVPSERLQMGYHDMNENYPFVIRSYESEESYQRAVELINSADVVIIGSAPESMLKTRKKQNKLILRYSERLLKQGFQLWKYPIRVWRLHRNNFGSKRIYMLCASAYAAADYRKFFLYRNKTYRWGYFPEAIHYDDPEALIAQKTAGEIVWVARFLDWKHPEIALEVAKRLKREGYNFHITMIGNGVLLDEITHRVQEDALGDCVSICGAMSPEEVRQYMETAAIHLFTSDRQEGWGAVLNESMNSACIPIADAAIGSVPYLIQNGKNGYAYRGMDDLVDRVKYLLDHPEEQKRLAKRAYATIVEEWNAEVAAARLLRLAEVLNQNGKCDLFADGVCSRAPVL